MKANNKIIILLITLTLLFGCKASLDDPEKDNSTFRVIPQESKYYGYFDSTHYTAFLMEANMEIFVKQGEWVNKDFTIAKIYYKEKDIEKQQNEIIITRKQKECNELIKEKKAITDSLLNTVDGEEKIKNRDYLKDLEEKEKIIMNELEDLKFITMNLVVTKLLISEYEGQVIFLDNQIRLYSRSLVVKLIISEFYLEQINTSNMYNYFTSSNKKVGQGKIKAVYPSEEDSILGKEAKYVVEFECNEIDQSYLRNETVTIIDQNIEFQVPSSYVFRGEDGNWYVHFQGASLFQQVEVKSQNEQNFIIKSGIKENDILQIIEKEA